MSLSALFRRNAFGTMTHFEEHYQAYSWEDLRLEYCDLKAIEERARGALPHSRLFHQETFSVEFHTSKSNLPAARNAVAGLRTRVDPFIQAERAAAGKIAQAQPKRPDDGADFTFE